MKARGFLYGKFLDFSLNDRERSTNLGFSKTGYFFFRICVREREGGWAKIDPSFLHFCSRFSSKDPVVPETVQDSQVE